MDNGTGEISRHTVYITKNGSVNGAAAGAAAGGGDPVLYAEPGENLYRLLRRSGVVINAPCGGKGRCGKCLARIAPAPSAAPASSVSSAHAAAPAPLPPPSPEETALLSDDLLRDGYRLTCCINVECDLAVALTSNTSATAKIATSGIINTNNAPFDPYVKKYAINMAGQSLEAQIPDAEQIVIALNGQYPARRGSRGLYQPDMRAAILPDVYSDIEILKKISYAASCDKGRVTCVCAGGRIIGVEPGDTGARCFGAAFDIGTTTIAGYLYDMTDGGSAAVTSALNPQAKFGADVITRINYTTTDINGSDEMRSCLLRELNNMLEQLAASAGIGTEEIYSVYIVGNTTMLHFYMGLPAGKIAAAPFIPVTTGVCVLAKRQSGLNINDSAVIMCLPGVSAYVGADTLAAALACGMDESNEVNILIDIGTNGEIFIGGNGAFHACSTAAGPAFEGASISGGVGGIEGAVDSVNIDPDGDISFTTIGNAGAIGICGSGLVDLIACLLRSGIIDETGRLLDCDEAEENGVPGPLCDRLVARDGGARVFRLVSADGVSAFKDIDITQRDIRELQNAKAAIAAGIKTLLAKAGFVADDIGSVFLAGGFGNYISVQSALDIGLIMREFDGRIVPAGNAAGAGAVGALLSDRSLERLTDMAEKTKYVELSASAEFTTAYVDCMIFE